MLPTYRNHIDEGGLAGILETDQGQLHFLLPEETLEVVDDAVQPRQHGAGFLDRPSMCLVSSSDLNSSGLCSC